MPFTAVAIAGGVQSLAGGIQAIGAGKRAKRYLAERRSYKISDEQYKTLQFGQNLAQSGYDPFTLKYLTDSADRNFESSLNAIQAMGGDVNDVSSLYDQNQQVIGKIGAENNLLQAKNFGVYLSLMEGIAKGKDAEWQSEQDLIKDKLQSAQKDKEAGMKMLGDGISLATNALMQAEQADIYKKEGALNREALKATKETKTPTVTEMIGSEGEFPNAPLIDYTNQEMMAAIPLEKTLGTLPEKKYSHKEMLQIFKFLNKQ